MISVFLSVGLKAWVVGAIRFGASYRFWQKGKVSKAFRDMVRSWISKFWGLVITVCK